ncbi:hypothetical protein I4U23_028158 [Adineta vaga]|nr:hypothetical protein I4U23_028158 [Adineta vaga]
MHKSKVVNTKRERRSSNNKNHNNNNIAKQPQTESHSTISALVTGLTSTQANMFDEKRPSETSTIKPTSIEINNHTNGVKHENGKPSPSKSLKLKIGNEHEQEIVSTTNGHHHLPPPNPNEHIYETPTNIESHPASAFETPAISSSDDHGNKSDENSHISSASSHHLNNGADSGISSEITSVTNNGTELDKTNFDDDLSSASGIASTSSIISAARQLETNINETNSHQRESSPTSGVVIPEEKRVTDRVKVFEAAASNNDHSTVKKQNTKNGHQKKAAPIHDQKQSGKRDSQISPTLSVSTTESVDTQTSNDSKVSSTTTNTSKNKSKRPSLKKQIQNLLKIDKPVSQDESTIIEEQTTVTNGKKANTLNTTRNKRDNDSTTTTTTTTVKRSSPPIRSQQNSPTNGNDTLKKRASPPLITPKRTSPRESPSKSQQHSPVPPHVTEFNKKPIIEPLEIRVEPNVMKKKSPSPPLSKTSNNGLLTSETDQRRSSTGVSKLIHTFQGNASHDLEQTVLVPRLRSPAQSINQTENVSYFVVFYLVTFT